MIQASIFNIQNRHNMKIFQAFLMISLLTISGLLAQSASGTYKLEYKGKHVSKNANPITKQVSGSSTLTVVQNGDNLTITMGDSGQGLWSANRMSGQKAGRNFVAALVNGSKSLYTITGSLVRGQLQGTYTYFRYGNPSTGIVPGWTRVRFTAKK